MGYWVKKYSDGSWLLGLEDDPSTSWSRTKLSDMVGVKLVRGGYNYTLEMDGPGEYWQSDTYEASATTGEVRMTKTRIEKRVEESKWQIEECDLETGEISLYSSEGKI